MFIPRVIDIGHWPLIFWGNLEESLTVQSAFQTDWLCLVEFGPDPIGFIAGHTSSHVSSLDMYGTH